MGETWDTWRVSITNSTPYKLLRDNQHTLFKAGGENFFQKSRSYLKILGTQNSKFRTVNPKILNATLQNFRQKGDLAPGIYAPPL
jgi:hypothetical protein